VVNTAPSVRPEPKLVWNPGEREALLESAPAREDVSRESDVLAQLSDDVESGKPLQLGRLRKLSEASLSDFIADVPAECLSVDALQWLLARLDARVVAQVAGIVQSKPLIKGVWRVAAPIEGERLARIGKEPAKRCGGVGPAARASCARGGEPRHAPCASASMSAWYRKKRCARPEA